MKKEMTSNNLFFKSMQSKCNKIHTSTSMVYLAVDTCKRFLPEMRKETSINQIILNNILDMTGNDLTRCEKTGNSR